MRTVDYHVTNEANESLEVTADEKGNGGASHFYEIAAENTAAEWFAKIRFQDGPIAEIGVNGATNEAVLGIVIDRLRCFQSGPFSCRENALALTKLEEAMHWLNERTRERRARSVEGFNKA